MKKIKFEGKLTLNKETIAKLNDNQMSKVNGGWLWTLINCASARCPNSLVTCPSAGVSCNTCPPADTEGCTTVHI